MNPPFPADRASLLRAVRVFLAAVNSRTGYHEDPEDDGKTLQPNGIEIDDVVVGLLAHDAEIRAVVGLEPNGEQDDLEEIIGEIQLLVNGERRTVTVPASRQLIQGTPLNRTCHSEGTVAALVVVGHRSTASSGRQA